MACVGLLDQNIYMSLELLNDGSRTGGGVEIEAVSLIETANSIST